MWNIDGRQYADTSNPQGGAIELPDGGAAMLLVEGSSIRGHLRLTPAGANLIFDIQHSATYEGTKTSIFDGTNYPTIVAGDTFTGDTSSNDGTIAPSYLLVDGGYLWLYVRQVGSTLNSEGFDLKVQVFAKVYVE